MTRRKRPHRQDPNLSRKLGQKSRVADKKILSTHNFKHPLNPRGKLKIQILELQSCFQKNRIHALPLHVRMPWLLRGSEIRKKRGGPKNGGETGLQRLHRMCWVLFFCECHAPPVLQGQIENNSLSALAQQPELRAYRLSPNRGAPVILGMVQMKTGVGGPNALRNHHSG